MAARESGPSFSARFSQPAPGRTLAMRMAGAYALLATIAVAVTIALRDGPPWSYPGPWIQLPAFAAASVSATIGIGFAALVVYGTRVAVARYAWAQRLHAELRPVAQDLRLRDVLVVAALSSLGEELLFRGLLTPTIGVIASSVFFGLAHQMKGPSRWIWMAWATLVGLALGAIFALTGSLVGPLVAHALVNAVNLSYLKDHEAVAP